MKKFIVFMIFGIGILATTLHTSYASPSPPDNVCIVAADEYAVDVVSSETAYVQVYQYATLERIESFELVAVKPPGECTANETNKDPDFSKMYSLNYRTCPLAGNVPYQKKFLAKNKNSINRFARDGLKQE